MTLPSIEELQRLLDETTPGEWIRHEEDGQIQNRDRATVAYADGHVHDDVELWIEWNLATDHALAALAPVLAAEVIRLRSDIERMREELSELGDENLMIAPPDKRVAYREAARACTRILEGDQP